MNLYSWALRHGVSVAAIQELYAELGLNGLGSTATIKGQSEAAVSAAIRLEAAYKGMRMWRNNVGALPDERGVPVRFGLANESKEVNEKMKSADLIGCRPELIEQRHVGMVFGRFVSREVKEPEWTYSGQGREEAQMCWAMQVCLLGGDASFATGVGTL